MSSASAPAPDLTFQPATSVEAPESSCAALLPAQGKSLNPRAPHLIGAELVCIASDHGSPVGYVATKQYLGDAFRTAAFATMGRAPSKIPAWNLTHMARRTWSTCVRGGFGRARHPVELPRPGMGEEKVKEKGCTSKSVTQQGAAGSAVNQPP